MDYGSVAIAALIAVLSYFATKAYEAIVDDLKDLKKSQYVANERLVRIESKEDQIQIQLEGNKTQTLLVYAQVDTVKEQINLMHEETRGSLKVAANDIAVTKSNFGRVLVILKGLIQEKTSAPKG